eukprot:scaffold3340_cov255-Pinguiococcus_pyrenoidosus.AAC.24
MEGISSLSSALLPSQRLCAKRSQPIPSRIDPVRREDGQHRVWYDAVAHVGVCGHRGEALTRRDIPHQGAPVVVACDDVSVAEEEASFLQEGLAVEVGSERSFGRDDVRLDWKLRHPRRICDPRVPGSGRSFSWVRCGVEDVDLIALVVGQQGASVAAVAQATAVQICVPHAAHILETSDEVLAANVQSRWAVPTNGVLAVPVSQIIRLYDAFSTAYREPVTRSHRRSRRQEGNASIAVLAAGSGRKGEAVVLRLIPVCRLGVCCAGRCPCGVDGPRHVVIHRFRAQDCVWRQEHVSRTPRPVAKRVLHKSPLASLKNSRVCWPSTSNSWICRA